jgi:hypothetical protein
MNSPRALKIIGPALGGGARRGGLLLRRHICLRRRRCRHGAYNITITIYKCVILLRENVS